MVQTDFLHDFIRRVGVSSKGEPVELFESVRRIPYAVTGRRSPQEVVVSMRGSCSGKHILLSLLFDLFGYSSKIVTVETTIDPMELGGEEMPRWLLDYADEAPITDFHHFVQLGFGKQALNLDATWDDSLLGMGFRVNAGWDGLSNTCLAFTPTRVVGISSADDVADFKRQLLETLTREQLERRRRFFDALTGWMDSEVRSTPMNRESSERCPECTSASRVG